MNEKVKPISPREVEDKKVEGMPSAVLEAFNELIAHNWNGHVSSVKQCDVVNLIKQKLKVDLDVEPKVEYEWLNVEPIYRKAGWVVEYDKPAYNEDYEATFLFKKKRNGRYMRAAHD